MAFGVVLGLPSSGSDDSNSNKPELILSKYSGEVNKNSMITFTVTTPSDGKLYVSSADANIATAAVNNKTIIINGMNYGSAIITVIQGAGTNYDISNSKEFLCIVKDTSIQVGDTLNETEWSAIKNVSTKGAGNAYWDIGDTKSITLNGTIGTLSLSNFACKVFILHFNYSMNGVADNNIIWGGFKDNNGVDIALIDSNYNQTSNNGTMYFNMNHWGNVNYGGWKGSDLRYDILGATSTQPSDYGKSHTTTCTGYDATSTTLTNPKAGTLLAALPANFRNSLRLWSRWIDAAGNSSNVDSAIKETVDAVTLLAEFEVGGTRCYANQYEQNHQSQMEYYRLGNSKIKHKHNDSSSVWWWLASPSSYNSTYFRIVDTINFAYTFSNYNVSIADSSGTVAPAFKT